MNKSPAAQPHLTFDHAVLGSFQHRDGIWTGRMPGADNIEVALAGDAAAPGEGVLRAAAGLIERFPEVKETALSFLLSQYDAPSREDFICEGIELLRDDCPGHFSISFVLFGDLGGIWRVEFEDGAPLFLTRDD